MFNQIRESEYINYSTKLDGIDDDAEEAAKLVDEINDKLLVVRGRMKERSSRNMILRTLDNIFKKQINIELAKEEQKLMKEIRTNEVKCTLLSDPGFKDDVRYISALYSVFSAQYFGSKE